MMVQMSAMPGQIVQMSDQERIEELEAEVAHADDLVDRLMLECEELRMELEMLREQQAAPLIPAHAPA